MRTVIVYPPDEQGGRRVRADGEILGRATSLPDIVEFLRRAGLDDVTDTDVAGAGWIEWRGGGPDVWEH
jgi:phosphoenolpyruvate synthase/pyruvate phosphate dikinase